MPVIVIGGAWRCSHGSPSHEQGALTVLEKPYQADDLTDAIRRGLDLARHREKLRGWPREEAAIHTVDAARARCNGNVGRGRPTQSDRKTVGRQSANRGEVVCKGLREDRDRQSPLGCPILGRIVDSTG